MDPMPNQPQDPNPAPQTPQPPVSPQSAGNGNGNGHKKPALQKPQVKKPPKELKICPSCKYDHSKEVTQCQQCGLIFIKYIDPQKRAAQAKLENLAQQAHAPISMKIKLFILFLISLPFIIAFVPEVNTKFLGGKLRYNIKEKQVLNFEGTAQFFVQAHPQKGSGLNHTISTQWNSNINGLGKSGGNVTHLGNQFGTLSFSGVPGADPILTFESYELNKYSNTETINSRGEHVSSGLSDGLAQQSRVQQHQARLRQKIEYGQDQRSFGISEEPPTPEEIPFYLTLDKGVMGNELKTMTKFFQFPKDRLRPGEKWNQRLNLVANAGQYYFKMNSEFSFELKGFVRKGSQYAAIIEWDQNLDSVKMVANDPNISPFTGELIVGGNYRGTALINYTDGTIMELNGDLTLTAASSEMNARNLLAQLEVNDISSSGMVYFFITQSVKRI